MKAQRVKDLIVAQFMSPQISSTASVLQQTPDMDTTEAPEVPVQTVEPIQQVATPSTNTVLNRLTWDTPTDPKAPIGIISSIKRRWYELRKEQKQARVKRSKLILTQLPEIRRPASAIPDFSTIDREWTPRILHLEKVARGYEEFFIYRKTPKKTAKTEPSLPQKQVVAPCRILLRRQGSSSKVCLLFG